MPASPAAQIMPADTVTRLISRIDRTDGLAFVVVPARFYLFPDLAKHWNTGLQDLKDPNAFLSFPNFPFEDIQMIVGVFATHWKLDGTVKGGITEETTWQVKFARPVAGQILDMLAQGKLMPCPQFGKVKKIDGIDACLWSNNVQGALVAAQETDELQIRFSRPFLQGQRPLKAIPGRANVFSRYREQIERKDLLGAVSVDKFMPLSENNGIFRNVSSACAWAYVEKPGVLSLRISILCGDEKKAAETAKVLLAGIREEMNNEQLKPLVAKIKTKIQRNNILFSLDLTPAEFEPLFQRFFTSVIDFDSEEESVELKE